ncbi:MAG: Fe-S protein assembly co-chaperone HscB [Ferruginibacter sp.]
MNYFELFEIPVSIKPDKAALTKKYFELQKKYHPDFYTKENEYEQADALELSSVVNKAYKVLQNADETIKYLLMQKGLLQEEEKYQLPPDFLMEVMELNENLSGDSAAAARDFETGIYNEVKQLIEQYNDSSVTTGDLQKIKEYYFKKKYLHRILERLDG